MQELGNAINDSLSESDRIAEAIGEIKRAGYDVFLVLEATIGFNRRDENAEDEDEDRAGSDRRAQSALSKPPARSSSLRRITASCAPSRSRWTKKTAEAFSSSSEASDKLPRFRGLLSPT